MTNVVKLIDHAVLHPTQTSADVESACALCREVGVASICVKPSHVALATRLLAGSSVLPSTVIGFPHGGTSTAAKVAETHAACQDGAREVDMVVNLGAALAGEWSLVADDIAAVVAAAREHRAITKVIFETGLLPDDATKIKLCELSEAAGAAFVKTSTGFGFVKGDSGALTSTGATVADIRLMRGACSPAVQVKASGGIRSLEDALAMVEAGATRLGTSATAAIAAGKSGASY
ncbi:deoxyribose-phosphate aldolase [Botrimarina hoheduenensis]|uniref:Deoxyribose-phosphate aldolase n=1 Tax=Botrimarina hoheduenensis TaxID=2528000 RepID=A0A5C5WFN0_9BACT|nr:deoxyribose-phosphate aldolase [Botrimarina hoheduenensis]TWT48911.1 Deoxyribose-phosphate aldolase 1 [Botrimarina hoheduenensis]